MASSEARGKTFIVLCPIFYRAPSVFFSLSRVREEDAGEKGDCMFSVEGE